MNTGRAMRAFTGIWTPGMTSQKLPTKMNVNSVSMKGVQREPVLAHRLEDDPLLHEVDGRLGDVLHAGRHERPLLPGDDRRARTRSTTESHISSTTLLTANGVREEQVGPLGDVADGRELQAQDHEVRASLAMPGLRPG